MSFPTPFRLRLFGSPALLDAHGDPLIGRAVHRHRLALLALLALAPGRAATRDRLIATLWPENDTENARQLLSQAVYQIRKVLGERSIITVADELRLNDEVVTADVAEFATALAEGDGTAAAALYAGPLLDGFFLPDNSEFERWADRERERHSAAYARSLETLAETAAEQGMWARAAEWWRIRAAHDPYDSRVALRLMQTLHAAGNGAGALRHATAHARLLQTEFGLSPAAEVPAFIERLREEVGDGTHADSALVRPELAAAAETSGDLPDAAHPSQPVAADASMPPIPAPAPAPESPAIPGRRPAGREPRRWLRAAVPAGVLVLLGTGFWAATVRDVDPEPSIVVLPFANLTGDGDNEYFSDGLTEEIISRLSSLDGLKVISRTSAMAYRNSQKRLGEIAQELNVGHVLEGSVRHVEGRVRITAQLIDAMSDAHLWAESYELDLHDSFRVQEQIAHAVAGALEVKLGKRAVGQIARRGTNDPEAYEMYRRGRWFWTQRTPESVAMAMRYFERAIARDSNFADAYTGLADSYLVSYQFDFGIDEDSAHSRHKWAAERALALDDASADAHTSAASALWWDGNWPGAERELQRALELNPGNASARAWYALLLFGMRRLEEAHEHAMRAYETDPFAIIVSITYANANYLLEDYDAAIEQWQKTLELNPDWVPALQQSAIAYSLQGKHDQALVRTTGALERAPNYSNVLADAAYVHARAGQVADARELLRRAKTNVIDAFHIGRAHVALGEPDSAFVWLERSRWKWPHRAQLADPALHPLRTDSRFEELTARVERAVGMR